MPDSPESPSAIRKIDQLLAEGGLTHGRRRLKAAGFERQVEHPAQTAPRKRASKDVSRGRVEITRPEAMSGIDWLLVGFSTRIGGVTTAYNSGKRPSDLNLGFTAEDSRENVLENRRRLLQEVAEDPEFPLVTVRQIHSSLTRRVTAGDVTPAEAQLRADGLMTSARGLLLGIQTADCIPVLIADRKQRAVAAFHAGWRGTLKRIVENGVGRMRLEFGSKPRDLVAAIGPGIGQCCYAVGEEVRSEFFSQFAYAGDLFRDVYSSDPVKEKYPLLFMTARAPGHSDLGPSLHLDLAEANRRQLLDAGLSPEAISVSGHCTSCLRNRYFSYRAERGFTGRMLSVIGIRK